MQILQLSPILGLRFFVGFDSFDLFTVQHRRFLEVALAYEQRNVLTTQRNFVFHFLETDMSAVRRIASDGTVLR